MSSKIEEYEKVYDVDSEDEEVMNVSRQASNNVIELSKIPNYPQPQLHDTKNYRLLSESIKRSSSPDELIFLPETDEKFTDNLIKKVRDDSRILKYEMWDTLIEKGRQIDEDVVRMMQNYIIRECNSNNTDNLEKCRKYREILEKYWEKNPSLREKQKRIGGRRSRSKKYTRKSKRKSVKKSNQRRKRKGKFTRK